MVTQTAGIVAVLARFCTRVHNHRRPLAVLVLLPVLTNIFALSGLFNNDPTLQFIGLGTAMHGGLIPGQMDWLDPTVGYITQPLGHLAAGDWVHGVVPWWNPYSGVGMPLAAEMQTAVFFLPFVLLLHWNCGWLLLRLLLQLLCGIFAYAFFIEIRLRRAAAVLGAALYSLSPIFFLSPHASINPLPFLPLLLLGIEYAARATREGKALGWSLITIAAAYSILGGFPETTYLDGLLAVVWTLWLISTLPPKLWPRFVGKLALGLVIALGICAPLLIPFFEYLPHANIGPHSGTLFTHNRLEATIVPLQIFPFLYGALNVPVPPSIAAAFGGGFVRVPSWVGFAVLTLAIAALWRRGKKPQPRHVLLGWLILWEARYLGLPPAIWLMNLIPGLATSDIIRFSGPMLAFCVFILAAFGFDDYLEQGPMRRGTLSGVAGTALLAAAAAVLPVASFMLSWWEQRPLDFLFGFLTTLLAVFLVIYLCFELRHPRHKYALLALLLTGPVFALGYTQFAGFRGGKIDPAPIQFLRLHTGTDRMMSLGPLDFNFPLRYGIASIDYASMPTPLDWTGYITKNLFADVDLSIYNGAAPGAQVFLLQHLAAYEALGVRYIVTRPDNDLTAQPMPLTALQARNAPHSLLPNTGDFLDTDGRRYSYAAMPNAGDFRGSLTISLASPEVSAVSVIAGTYLGSARGLVTLTVCAAGTCETATADAALAQDNEPLMFQLPAPLTIPPGTDVSFRFNHPEGKPVAIWLAPGFYGTEVPSFSFIRADGSNDPGFVLSGLSLAFKDDTAAIYQLANTLPYASATDGNCKIGIISRTEMHSSCTAPDRLLRREMYFAGWSATVNGADAKISAAGLFQSIALPPGESEIHFAYAPPHIRPAYALALLAFALWFALWAWDFNARRR